MNQKPEGANGSKVLSFVQKWAPLLTLLATVGIAIQNNRVQLQIADIKSTQDKELEQVKRELASPKIIITKEIASLEEGGIFSSLVNILNSSGSEAKDLRVDFYMDRVMSSVNADFPH